MKLIITVFTLLMLASCSKTPNELRNVKEKYSLDTLILEQGYNSYVNRCFIKDNQVEAGRVTFLNGDYAEYWFKSHHATNDNSYTLFVFSDGKEILMKGFFCCEVDLPMKQLKDKNQLKEFISKNDGIRP